MTILKTDNIPFNHRVINPVVRSRTRHNKDYGSVLVSDLIRVVDGDTIAVNLHGGRPIIASNILIRIKDIDTPELDGLCVKESELAILAKTKLESLLAGAKVIELRNCSRGKYFRIVADIYADGINVGRELLATRHAVIYDARAKKDWCLQP